MSSELTVEGASGEELRHYAIEGMSKELRNALSNIANPASVDDFGQKCSSILQYI